MLMSPEVLLGSKIYEEVTLHVSSHTASHHCPQAGTTLSPHDYEEGYDLPKGLV